MSSTERSVHGTRKTFTQEPPLEALRLLMGKSVQLFTTVIRTRML